mmetsp:Transcript_16494/g.33674  ORF Transcript_16494/g.33674 Transcript_16494/m.33674 type:complete len:135 (-) Transcript_16494:90-494(-)
MRSQHSLILLIAVTIQRVCYIPSLPSGTSLLLLLIPKLKVLASLNDFVGLILAARALESQHNLLRRLRFLVKNRLGLPSKSALLPIVTPLPLCVQGILALFILRHLVQLMLPAVFTRTKSLPSFWNDDHHEPRF